MAVMMAVTMAVDCARQTIGTPRGSSKPFESELAGVTGVSLSLVKESIGRQQNVLYYVLKTVA